MKKLPKVSGEDLDQFRSLVFEVMPEMLEDYILEVRASEDVEDKRKFLAWASSVVGAEAKKDEQKPQLPTFQFNFALGGVQAQQDAAAQVLEVVDQVTGAIELPAPDPEFLPSAVPPDSMAEIEAAFAQLSEAKPC